MQKFYKFFLVLSCLVVFSFQALYSQDIKVEADEVAVSKIEERATEKYLRDHKLKSFRYVGTTEIDEDENINGNIIVVDGNLEFSGVVTGDILVIDGDVYLESGAMVHGNVTSVEGTIRQDEDTRVKGSQLETKAKNLFSSHEWDSDYEYDSYYPDRNHYGPYSTLPLHFDDNPFLFNYNRVQGFFLGWKIPKKITGKYRFLSIHGFGGYGFSEKTWRYEIGADRWFFNQTDYRFEVGAKAYDLTDTKDTWLLTPCENTVSSLILHRDYQDFYRRNGYEVHASQNLSIFFKGTLAYRNDDYSSLSNHTNWALFGKRDFRDNPLIDEGNMRSLFGELYFDNRNDIENPSRGWFAKLQMESSNSKLKSDFSFNQYIFELRRYQPLGRHERLDMRVKVATSEGDVPLQKRYHLGGVGTLRGYKYKTVDGGSAFGGDRMLLANVEYYLDPRSWGGDFLFFDDLNYILFFDVGRIWNRADVTDDDSWSAGFSDMGLNDLKSNIGIAFTTWEGKARLSIAKRTDTNKNSVLLTLRLSKPF